MDSSSVPSASQLRSLPLARRLSSTSSTTSTTSSSSTSKQEETYGFRSTTTQAPPSQRSNSIDFSLPPSTLDQPRRTREHGDRSAPVARGIDKDNNCDRRRPEEEDRSRLVAMSPQLVAKTLTPFLKDHIPGTYAPLAKPLTADGVRRDERSNSRFCYRHRPDILCRKAADETKMVRIQSELDRLPPDDRQAITHVWSLFSAAPSKHRDLMLQGIMTQCCFPQLSTVAREVQDQLKIDFITALPNELSFKILGYLDAVSLCRAAAVSRQWRELAEDDQVWHRICEQHIDRKCTKCGWGLPLLEQKKLREWTKRKQRSKQLVVEEEREKPRIPLSQPVIAAPNTPKSPSPKRDLGEMEGTIAKRRKVPEMDVEMTQSEQRSKQWKKLYRERFKVGSNWKYGRCKFRTFKGHQNGVTCLQLDDSILASGSYDSTIKIWNIETGEELRTLVGHTGGIRALQFDDNILISGSLDNTVKVWNWHTGELINSLQCHTDGVISVNFEGSWLATGSIDKTVRIFNFETRESFCLRGHEDWVNQVRICLTSRTVLSASDDCTVKLWDLDSKQCLRTFTGHIGHVQQVLPLPHDFEPDDEFNSDAMSIASNRASTPLPTVLPAVMSPGSPPLERSEDIRASYGATFTLDQQRPLPARYILTGSLDSTVGLWDTATGRCLKKWFGHLEGIWGLVGDTLRVVTGAQDGAVKVWEPKAGKCERTFTGPRGPVTCVGLSDSRMASGSEDGEVRVYSFHDMAGLEELGTPS